MKRRETEERNERDTAVGRMRYIAPGCVFAVLLLLMLLRIAQIGRWEPLLPGEIAAGERTVTVTVPAQRGQIFDRNGTLLVGNNYTYELDCDARQFAGKTDAVAALFDKLVECGITGDHADAAALEAAINEAAGADSSVTASEETTDGTGGTSEPAGGDTGAAESDGSAAESGDADGADGDTPKRNAGGRLVLSDNAPMSMIAYVISDRPAGLSIEKRSERVYYDDGAAAQLLGHIGRISDASLQYYSDLGYPMDAIVGTSGAEAIFEEYLHGTDGSMRVTYDGAGNVTSTEYLTEPTRGADIYLTLDIGLQKTALEALNAQLEAVGSQCGATVALDPASGEVLVCLSLPTYSQEQYKNDWQTLAATEGAPLFNRATEGRYAPGSIMKLSTAVAALEEGIITPQTTVTDEGVYTYYDDFQPECWLWGRRHETHGSQNVRSAIMNSCNYFFYEIGRQTGIDKLNEWSLRLGLGQKAGIELRESEPVLAGRAERRERGEYWGEGETLAAAIGQSDNLFTPLQTAAFISVIAEGGEGYRAHLLLRAVAPDGTVKVESQPEQTVSASLSAETIDAVRGGMYDAARSGTVERVFADCGYDIAAKTGTAQISSGNSNALFACYAPFVDPQVAVVCVIENGTDGYNAAAPAEPVISSYLGQ